MNDKKSEEQDQHIAHLEAKYSNVKRRYVSQKAKIDAIYEHPFRFLLSRWYHKFIKKDQIT
jgi:hypothetical protein